MIDFMNLFQFQQYFSMRGFPRKNESQHTYTFNPKYQIGNPFQQPNEKQNFQNMKARDPSGNVRWKGAFTGGFQAGYKNTCGSKQGWAPSTFVSSRTNRFESSEDKVENNIFDYMDEQDIGGLDIAANIQVRQQFSNKNIIKKNKYVDTYGQVLVNVNAKDSIGDRILKKMKRNQAQITAPENMLELSKLLQNYSQNQAIEQEDEQRIQIVSEDIGRNRQSHPYYSIGFISHPPQDQFVMMYTEMFNKIVRKPVQNYQNEQEEENQKQLQSNKVYFDFTKPLDEEPDYLKEIKQIDQIQKQQYGAKPRKRLKNVINENRLANLFNAIKQKLDNNVETPNNNSYQQYIKTIASDYDPYYRLKQARNKQKQFLIKDDINKRKHRIFTIKERSDIIGQNKTHTKLADKFVKAGSSVDQNSSNKFIKAGQNEIIDKDKQILSNSSRQDEKIFSDQKKNNRFWDWILELEGKKISAQLQYLQFQEAEKERHQFEIKYKELKQNKITKQDQISKQLRQQLPSQIQKVLTAKGKAKKEVVRRIGTWKPQKILCKRFGCVFNGGGHHNMSSYHAKSREDNLYEPYN